jgi:hypothetical protein
MGIFSSGGWAINFNMNKNNTPYIMLVLSACLFLACKRGDCPLTPGSPASEERALAPFNSITLYGKVNLILTQDSLQQVTVSGGKNLLPGIVTSVSGQTLTIQDNNACLLSDPSGRVDVSISTNQLQKITYYGAGDVHSTNTLKAPQFTVDCWLGSGTIRLDVQAVDINALARNENTTIVLTGKADSSYIYCSEAGSVDMSGCTTAATEIDTKSVRDIYVDASRALHAHILYRGNVFYRSEPSVIDTRITSTGKLIHIN